MSASEQRNRRTDSQTTRTNRQLFKSRDEFFKSDLRRTNDKVATETELIVGQTAFDAVNKIKGQSENEISQLSAASVTYIGLERQVKITQTVYAELMKSYEQARIQEAQESMDIQIVDRANMPIRPSAPNKTLTVVIGFILGMMLSTMYVIVIYMRQKKG